MDPDASVRRKLPENPSCAQTQPKPRFQFDPMFSSTVMFQLSPAKSDTESHIRAELFTGHGSEGTGGCHLGNEA